MLESGGTSTQSGILYQNTLAALFLGRLCDVREQAESERVIQVRVEAPGEVDDVVVMYADGHGDWCQVKENVAKRDRAWRKMWKGFESRFYSEEFRTAGPNSRLILQVGAERREHTLLQGLCLKASGSETYEEWWGGLNMGQKSLLQDIREVLDPKHAGDEALRSLMSRVHLDIASLKRLEDQARSWMPPADKRPSTLLRLVRDRIGEHARVRKVFVAHELRATLESNDQVRFETPTDLEELRSRIQALSAPLREYENRIEGIHIERPEIASIASWARDAGGEARLAFLLDRAGSGKTVAMHDILEELERTGVAVLAIRADQQLTGVETDAALQERLALSERLENAIGRLAELERVVVLVDQVDALSLTLSSAPQTLDYALGVIARLRSIPNVRTVVSCRSFDYSTDPRLRQVQTDRKWQLDDFRDEDVASVVQKLGGDAEQLLQAERELLRTPLHLGLYGRMLVRWREAGAQPRHFRSLQELYEELWRLVILPPGSGDHGPEARAAVLRLMTDYMTARRTTSVPRAWLERSEHRGLGAAIRHLASSGILTSGAGGPTWTFMHQTFLDYCYARGFVERGGSLAGAILSGPQGLFERSQMVQVLSYLRGADEGWYRGELQELIDSPNLQPHLKSLLLSWLSDLADPSQGEWEPVRSLLLNSETRPRMLRALHGKTAWWPFLRSGMDARLQQADEVVDGEWIPYLSSVADEAQDDVVALMEPYFGRSQQWDVRVGRVLEAIRTWSSPATVRLYDRWVRSRPDVNLSELYLLPEVAKGEPGDPETACGLLRYVLHDYVRRAPAASGLPGEGRIRQLLNNLHNDYSLRQSLETLSERVPDRFVREMLPWVECVAVASTEGQDDTGDYRHDALAFGWHYHVGAFEERFIRILVGALQSLARSARDAFRAHADWLRRLPYVTAQRLVAVGYTAAPELYWEDALAFLLEDGRRLGLGDRDDYDSLKLVQALCPHLSHEQNARLEEAILAYQPPNNGNARQVLRFRELRHLRLLSAMSPQHLTQAGRHRLQELDRKYGEYPVPKRAFSMVVGHVQSPIKPEAIAKMSNAQWLGAIAKYSGDTEHPDLLRGGAAQLANELRRRTREQPFLSHELAIRDFAPDVDARYLDAVMRGLAEADVPSGLLFDVVRRFRDREEPDVRRGAAWALRKRADQDIPSDLLDLLEAWTRGPALDDEGWWERQDEQRAATPDANHAEGDPYESYLNSVRGYALDALLQALHAESTPDAREREWALLEWVSCDGSSALRAGAAEHLSYLLYADDERAVQLFGDILEDCPELLRSAHTQRFVYYALRKHFGRMRPYIRKLLDNEDPEQRRVGAQFACLAAFTQPESEKLVSEVMGGYPEHRRGAAGVYAANYRQPGLRAVCEAQLLKLLDDPESQVRWEVGTCFGGLADEDFESVRGFLEAFAASRALGDYPHLCIEYVYNRDPLEPDWSMKFVELVLNNPATGGGALMHSDIELLIRIVLRIYDRYSDITRQRALDAFNALLDRFPGQAQAVLSEYERR